MDTDTSCQCIAQSNLLSSTHSHNPLPSHLSPLPLSTNKVLNNGVSMPVIGLGTWQLDGRVCEEAVYEAIKLGNSNKNTDNTLPENVTHYLSYNLPSPTYYSLLLLHLILSYTPPSHPPHPLIHFSLSFDLPFHPSPYHPTSFS